MPSSISIIDLSKLLDQSFIKSPCFIKIIMFIQY
jgi:hypothetical protein